MSTSIQLYEYDYQAPLTSNSLAPNSKWLIVRRNIHKIRSWGIVRRTSILQNPCQDWYIYFQMRRELKGAEEEIRQTEYRRNFTPVKYFDIPVDEVRLRRFNVSHVRPIDGIYYSALGSEPIGLQNLLYYFSKESVVPYNSMFYSFMLDVSSVLNTNRQRIRRVAVYQKVAFIFALTIFTLIFMMFFSLILSVYTTITKLNYIYRADSHA